MLLKEKPASSTLLEEEPTVSVRRRTDALGRRRLRSWKKNQRSWSSPLTLSLSLSSLSFSLSQLIIYN